MALYWSKLLRVIVVALLCHYGAIVPGYCSAVSTSTSGVEKLLQTEETTQPSLGKELEDNNRYKTMEANATLMKLLVNNKKGVSKSEVFDMLHSRDDNDQHVDLPTFPKDDEESRIDVPLLPDSQAEFLQAADTPVAKDSRRARYMARGETPTIAAGIMVVVTCSIVLIGYTSLVVYRRIYLKKHGLKHELLRNEENVAETRIEL